MLGVGLQTRLSDDPEIAALRKIDGEASVKEPTPCATSTDAGETFEDGRSRGLWEAAVIAREALA